MAEIVKDLRALPLQELIGAPLVALVQAQALAARATVDFVEQVGFIPGSDAGDPASLRMAEFHYEKNDATGTPATFAARVPVLSLVPVPGIQIKNARIAFTAKISDAFTEPAGRGSSSKTGGATPGYLQPVLTHFRGSLAPERKPGAGQGDARGSCELIIEVNIEQMPLAPGMEKILQMMDQSIQDAVSVPQPSPQVEAFSKGKTSKPPDSGRKKK